MTEKITKLHVQNYYGKTLQTTTDLQTNACCDSSSTPDWLRDALNNIHQEVNSKYYGCGLVAPEKLGGAKILDLGSGSGRDCYLLAQLVGEDGFVLGVDMTDERLATANRHIEYHRDKFGFVKSNVEFKKGYVENLNELGLEDDFFDIVISNCVINLSPDKAAVLKEVKRVLKPGGEMYFSDVYTNRRVPAELVADPVLYGECLSGALYWNDFLNLAKASGFLDPRLAENRQITISNPKVLAKTQGIKFFSATYRLFNIDSLESHCEDYRQAVKYLGGIPGHDMKLNFDNHHKFEKNKTIPVCGNTFLILRDSRFSKHFEFYGNFDIHYGIYQGCSDTIPFSIENKVPLEADSCC